MSSNSAGARFRAALAAESPLQIVGAINANHALLAQQAGYKAVYLSGGGVAAGSLGVPDLGITGLEDVLIDARRITDVCELPLLVDVDTGFGASAFNVARTTKAMIKAGVAAMHIRIKSARNVADIARTNPSCRPMKWSIASKPQSMRAPMSISSSWHAPMRLLLRV